MESKNIEKEVDVIDIGRGIKTTIYGAAYNLVVFYRFLKQNILLLLLLLLVGSGVGYGLDKYFETYISRVIVSANFESADYLYNTIELINSKIKQKDKKFLESIGLIEHQHISKIEVKPVIDVYHFINQNPNNFEMIKLLSESGDPKSTITDLTTSKNYAAHEITLKTDSEEVSQHVIEKILNYLNKNRYHEDLRAATIQMIDFRITSNKEMIDKIDRIVEEFSSNTQSAAKTSDKLVYYNDNMQLNDIIATRNTLVIQQGNLQLDKEAYAQFIKEKSTTLNIRDTKAITSKLKVVLPMLFLIFYLAGNLILRWAQKVEA
jgi:hypothetical protein